MARPGARIRSWWLARVPPQDHIELGQRNVYILPTKAGLMLGATLLLLLVSSINYQLNLGYVLTFMIAGSALVAMHVGHGTLRGLHAQMMAGNPVHAGQTVAIGVRLNNPAGRTRFSIGLSWRDMTGQAWIDIERKSQRLLHLQWHPQRRGLQSLPMVMIRTLYPLGCFRVWALWRPAQKIWVYPRAEDKPPPLPLTPGTAPSAKNIPMRSFIGEPDTLRPYRKGDPLKNIVWKKAAHTGELISRDFESGQDSVLWLSPASTGLADLEAQLSRLCAWVLQAQASGLTYGLRLSSQVIDPGTGKAHMQKCLHALAAA